MRATVPLCILVVAIDICILRRLQRNHHRLANAVGGPGPRGLLSTKPGGALGGGGCGHGRGWDRRGGRRGRAASTAPDCWPATGSTDRSRSARSAPGRYQPDSAATASENAGAAGRRIALPIRASAALTKRSVRLAHGVEPAPRLDRKLGFVESMSGIASKARGSVCRGSRSWKVRSGFARPGGSLPTYPAKH